MKTISGHNGCGSGGQGAQTGQGDEDPQSFQGGAFFQLDNNILIVAICL